MTAAKNPATPKPEAKQDVKPEAPAAEPTSGYFRTRENVVVWREYLPNGMSAQRVVQSPQGTLPEGVTNAMVTNDE